MKTNDIMKQMVLLVGVLILLFGIVGLWHSTSLMEQFFPIYTGFTLIGTVLLHKDNLKIKTS